MKQFSYLIILFSALLLSSCAFHSGMMTSNANLGNEDFQVLTMGMGSAETQHVFGIGGLDKQALVYEAKKNLYRAYPLGKNQVYANVTVDFKRSNYLIVFTTLATVTADVIQFGEISAADSAKYLLNSSTNRELEVPDSSNTGLFYPGQIANIYEQENAVPVRILEKIYNRDKYKVEYLELTSGDTKIVRESDRSHKTIRPTKSRKRICLFSRQLSSNRTRSEFHL